MSANEEKPVAWIGWREECQAYDLNVSGFGEPLYKHPAKTLTNEEYKPLTEADVPYQKVAPKEAADAIDKALGLKTLTDEEIMNIAFCSEVSTVAIENDWNGTVIEFARAILRKAQEKQ